jgi:UDP-N-acetylmuramoyl-L-alanyl-D-glutamate--2,6-diaminopimelate ligase
VEATATRTAFTWRSARVELRLRGIYHVANALGAATAAAALDVPVPVIAEGLASAPAVPGRFEVVESPAPFSVVVDYAHPPDGLRTALVSARRLAAGGRVVCVFGCGGDRDPGKRPKMGEAVARGADVAIVTNDNPRSEDPRAIAEAILPGLRGGRARFSVELDRRAAIARAIGEAEAGDVVLIAGKGHEPYQIIGDATLPFDDREEARRALAARRAARGGG